MERQESIREVQEVPTEQAKKPKKDVLFLMERIFLFTPVDSNQCVRFVADTQ